MNEVRWYECVACVAANRSQITDSAVRKIYPRMKVEIRFVLFSKPKFCYYIDCSKTMTGQMHNIAEAGEEDDT